MDSVFVEQRVISDMLYPSYAKRLQRYIADLSCQLYIQLALIYSTKIDASDVAGLLERIKADWLKLQQVFETTTSKTRIFRNEKLVGFLTSALEAPFPKLLPKIVNLKIFMKDNFDDNCVKCILRMRREIEVERRHTILEAIKKETQSINRLVKPVDSKDKNTDGDVNRRNRLDLKIKKFVYRIRLAVEEKKNQAFKGPDSIAKEQSKSKELEAEIKAIIEDIQQNGLDIHETLHICCMPRGSISKTKKDFSKR